VELSTIEYGKIMDKNESGRLEMEYIEGRRIKGNKIRKDELSRGD